MLLKLFLYMLISNCDVIQNIAVETVKAITAGLTRTASDY